MNLGKIGGIVVLLAMIATGALIVRILWDADAWIRALHRDTHRNLVVIGGAATDLEKTLRAEREAAAAQLADADAAAKALARVSSNLDALVRHTDENLNGSADKAGILPALGATISDQNTQFVALERQAETNLATLDEQERQLAPLLAAATQAAQSAAAVAGDPHIAETLQHLDETTAHLNQTAAHIDGTTADIQAYIHRMTTPIRGTWNAIKGFLTTFAGPAAQVATASKP